MVRCHRAAIDFDTQFCNAVFNVGMPVVKKEKKRRKKTIAGGIVVGLLVLLLLRLFSLMCTSKIMTSVEDELPCYQ